MRNKRRQRKTQEKNNNINEKESKEYTTEELIELGKKLNTIKIAPPLYNKESDNKTTEQD